MASIVKRNNKDGSVSYQTQIRIKGIEISKTFSNEDDAILYAKYKERLIENKKNFEVNIKERVTLEQVFELKIHSLVEEDVNRKTFEQTNERFKKYFKETDFISSKPLDYWLEVAKDMYKNKVYRGAKTAKGERDMSPLTLKRIFAYASSAISYAREQGIAIENHAMTVIQVYINGLIKQKQNVDQ